MGLALIWLGVSLWSDQRRNATQATPSSQGSHLDRAAAA